MRNGWPLLAFFLLILGPVTLVQACPSCSASSLCVLPGFNLIGFHVGFVLPILCAFVERPFVTLAGVKQSAIAVSLQANFLSAIVTSIAGLFVLGAAWGPAGEQILIAWMPAAVVLSTVIETVWIKRRVEFGRVRWGWLLLGNILSAAVAITLPFWRATLAPKTLTGSYIRWMTSISGSVVLSTLLIGLAAYVVAFLWTGFPSNEDRRRGFEVIRRAPSVTDL